MLIRKISIQNIMFKINPNMQYRNFGNTGLVVSDICYGNAGNQSLSHEDSVAIVKRCLELGINFFDTAELYWQGQSETSFGKIFKQLGVQREQIVVGTKIWIAKNPDLNSLGNTNKKHIKQSVKASLKRLQMDYVDIIYPHSYDENSSMEQICRTFHEIIEDGDAFYWGTSNWDASKIIEAFEICEKYNLHKPIAAQNQYNMMVRQQMQKEYITLFRKYGYGLVGYNTILGGYLTGKYLSDGKGRFNEENSKIKQLCQQLYLDMNIDQNKCDQILKQVKVFAEKQMQCTMAQLAIAWSLKFQHLSSALLGVRSIQQLQNSLVALQVKKKLTPELQGKLNKILGTHPAIGTDFKSWKPQKAVRPLAQ